MSAHLIDLLLEPVAFALQLGVGIHQLFMLADVDSLSVLPKELHSDPVLDVIELHSPSLFIRWSTERGTNRMQIEQMGSPARL